MQLNKQKNKNLKLQGEEKRKLDEFNMKEEEKRRRINEKNELKRKEQLRKQKVKREIQKSQRIKESQKKEEIKNQNKYLLSSNSISYEEKGIIYDTNQFYCKHCVRYFKSQEGLLSHETNSIKHINKMNAFNFICGI